MNEMDLKDKYVEGVFNTLSLMLKRQKYYRLVINGSVFKYSEGTSNRKSVVGVSLVNGVFQFCLVLSSTKQTYFENDERVRNNFINAIYDTRAYGLDLTGVTKLDDISIHVATDLNLILIETATFKFIRDNLVFASNGGLGDESIDDVNYYNELKSILRGMDFSNERLTELDDLYLRYNNLFTKNDIVFKVDKSMSEAIGGKTYLEFNGGDLEYVRDLFLYRLKSNYIDIFNISMNALKSRDTNYMSSFESQFLNYTGALLSGSRDYKTFLPVFISHDDFINPYLDYIPNVVKLFRNFTPNSGVTIRPVEYGNFFVYYFTQFEINLMLDNRNLVYLDSRALQIWLLNKTYKGEENTVYIRALDSGSTMIDYYTYNAMSKSEKAMFTPRPASDILAITLSSLLGIEQNKMLDIVNGRDLL